MMTVVAGVFGVLLVLSVMCIGYLLRTRSAPALPPPPVQVFSPVPERVPFVERLAGGLPPVEPPGLPDARDAVPDSVVDGATLGPVVVRAVSVRGDQNRRALAARREHFLTAVVDFATPTLLTVVATGAQHGEVGAAATVSRGVLTQVSRLGKSIADAWTAGERETMRELVHSVFHGTANRLRELAGHRAVPERDTATEVVCLLTDLGPAPTARRHLAFGVGTGTVLTRTADGWTPAIPPRPAASLPSQADASWFTPLRSGHGDTLVVTGGAATRVFLNPDSGGHFARLWRSKPRDLAEFLWEFSTRTTITGEDRTAVCLWDTAE